MADLLLLGQEVAYELPSGVWAYGHVTELGDPVRVTWQSGVTLTPGAAVGRFAAADVEDLLRSRRLRAKPMAMAA